MKIDKGQSKSIRTAPIPPKNKTERGTDLSCLGLKYLSKNVKNMMVNSEIIIKPQLLPSSSVVLALDSYKNLCHQQDGIGWILDV